ncbi:DUF948 domain-containing protein [Amphibacillus sediminis]|uniref:DUF948 domain-containing protein n=1 Tax=Amphibacillus sediminis TaxID=360185 RepID=UPI000831427E|nr:DUF948 domain-containing protein [Amphibacillus sediminis]
MINLLYIAAFIFALAFAALVVYVIKILKPVADIANTLEGMKQQFGGLTTEATKLLSHTNKLAEDINDKSKRLNVVVDSITDLSITFNGFNHSIQQVTDSISRLAEDNKEETAQAIKWGTIIMELFKKRKGRNEHSL